MARHRGCGSVPHHLVRRPAPRGYPASSLPRPPPPILLHSLPRPIGPIVPDHTANTAESSFLVFDESGCTALDRTPAYSIPCVRVWDGQVRECVCVRAFGQVCYRVPPSANVNPKALVLYSGGPESRRSRPAPPARQRSKPESASFLAYRLTNFSERNLNRAESAIKIPPPAYSPLPTFRPTPQAPAPPARLHTNRGERIKRAPRRRDSRPRQLLRLGPRRRRPRPPASLHVPGALASPLPS